MNFDTQVLNVPVEDIVPNRFQPRINFEDASLKELADSIRQHGIIQPLVLRKIGDKYEIVAGERRYRASKMAGLTTIPAVIAKIDEKTNAEIVLAENIQTKKISAVEEARSYKALLDQGYMSISMLAQKLGLPTQALQKKLALLNLCNEVQDAIIQNQISERHGRSLLQVKDKATQINLLNKVINERMTVKQLNDYIDANQDLKGDNAMNPDLFSNPMTLGETISENSINDLESQSANLNMEEPTSIFASQITPPPVSSINENPSNSLVNPISSIDNNIDSLDILEPISNVIDGLQAKPNINEAIDKITNLVNELKNMGYEININKNDTDLSTLLNIEIKK